MVRKFDVKRTKIVCTLGPSTNDPEVIRQMIRVGMDVARVNFSHGSHEEHAARINMIRQVAEEEDAVVAILADLQGPKIRLGKIVNDGVEVKPGEKLTLTINGNADGSNMVFPLPNEEFVKDVLPGHTLLIDDGTLQFRVISKRGMDLICEVIVGGELKSRKGVSAPEAKLTLGSLTEKDEADAKFALDVGVEYIAMSFVRSRDDMAELRWLCKRHGHAEVALIAKIEKREALDKFEEILDASDGIMVARGDLGVETPAEGVPIEQKRIIRRCNEVGKPVITATQMLQSMTDNPRPTRAEASDVANAIFDGTDAVMLSAETASGKYPIDSVKMMTTIAVNVEKHLGIDERKAEIGLVAERGMDLESLRDTFAVPTTRAATVIADSLNAKLIVTTTYTGTTARLIARSRPKTAILCVTPVEITRRRMALVWGVYSILVPVFSSIDEMLSSVLAGAKDALLVEEGDVVVMIAGVPFGKGGHANFLKIHRVGEPVEVQGATPNR
jgi:pyruvate kinase